MFYFSEISFLKNFKKKIFLEKERLRKFIFSSYILKEVLNIIILVECKYYCI